MESIRPLKYFTGPSEVGLNSIDRKYFQIPGLGGGNSNIFGIFTPKLGEDLVYFDLRIFFKGVETTN